SAGCGKSCGTAANRGSISFPRGRKGADGPCQLSIPCLVGLSLRLLDAEELLRQTKHTRNRYLRYGVGAWNAGQKICPGVHRPIGGAQNVIRMPCLRREAELQVVAGPHDRCDAQGGTNSKGNQGKGMCLAVELSPADDLTGIVDGGCLLEDPAGAGGDEG